MNIKAIVMDMDGTLLNSKDKISPKTKDALIECQKNGIKIVLASGRNYGRIKPYLEEFILKNLVGYSSKSTVLRYMICQRIREQY